jgi:hypothetical protein
MIVLAAPRYLAGRYGAGNWKDVQATRLLLARLDEAFEMAEFDEQNPGDLLGGRSRVDHLIVHYSWWPDAFAAVRRTAPETRLHVRTHNAEALQHLQRAGFRPLPTYRHVRALYGAVRLGWRDARCRRIADTLLGISAWDNEHYWRHLPGRARIHHLPYWSPWGALRPGSRPRPWADREDLVVSMPGARDAIGGGSVRGLTRLSRELRKRPAGGGWRFQLTQGVLAGGGAVPESEGIEVLQHTVEPWDLLCRARALAVLTPFGFGTQTTIIDGLAAGAHVLVHPRLVRRLPTEIAGACLAVDPWRENDLDGLLGRLRSEPKPDGLNDRLRDRGLRVIRQAVGIWAEGPGT